ncbi:uncharacterized protein LOC115614433 [Strigops habroptila]|uniref:uncharacterized protein LOC115614433 n=1 Tax=Strigops habroptila TaxID=2489341 RepID=UPI0011CED71E|nr:uncharacterized protein LOC115614433 [Strigops habroptila]
MAGSRLHPPLSVPTGPQPGLCCGTCRVTAALPPQGPLWGAWSSPSGCWDPREGCAGLALPYPCHRARPARSMESLSSAASSAADSTPSAGSPPAPRCPGAEAPAEETLSTALASCRVSASASAAIDRRSFIATGLAAELLEELLSRRLPAPEPEQDDGGPEERCCATGTVTTSPSLERLRRHNQGFQRAMESFREPAWVPLEAPACPGQRRRQAQPCGRFCRDTAWHAAHGCCARVEPVPGAGHQRGPNPGPAAPTRSETSCAQQRHKHRGCPRDAQPAPGTGTAIGSHEPRQCRRGTAAAAKAGREPPWEPELSRQPYGQEGLAVSLRCRDAEPEPAPGCGCGCVLGPRSHPPDTGWVQQEWDVPVPESCCRELCAPGATNMVRVIARTFELRAQQDPRVPPVERGAAAALVPAQSRRSKAGARNGARRGARS